MGEFQEERVLFAYHGEPELEVQLWRHRPIPSLLHSDSLIGGATLPLSMELSDTLPRSIDLAIAHRKRGETGTVSLRYVVRGAAPPAPSTPVPIAPASCLTGCLACMPICTR